ncbi:MAG: hypothetical protein AAB604_01475 [Patescibacteria group bacterium]
MILSATQEEELPYCGDRGADSVFRRVVHFLRTTKVYRKDVIFDPHRPRCQLYGRICRGHKEVFVVHRPPHYPAARNLLHEGLHAIHAIYESGVGRETAIENLENKLWCELLTYKQKCFLGRFVPRHSVKKEPCHTIKKNNAGEGS